MHGRNIHNNFYYIMPMAFIIGVKGKCKYSLIRNIPFHSVLKSEKKCSPIS